MGHNTVFLNINRGRREDWEDGLIAYISDFHLRYICIETYFMNFILFILFVFIFYFFYVFSFIGLNLSHRNQKVSMVHTEFFGRKSRTFQGLFKY